MTIQTSNGASPVSAAHITITPPSAALTTADEMAKPSVDTSPGDEAPFDALRQLKQSLASLGQDQQVIIMLHECIELGIVEGKRLTGILEHLGFNRRHVGIQLSRHTGHDPSRHWWYRDENRSYRILVPLDQPRA